MKYTPELYFKSPPRCALFAETRGLRQHPRHRRTLQLAISSRPEVSELHAARRLHAEQYLRQIVRDGVIKRFGERGLEDPAIKERINGELAVLEKQGFVNYFLIVWDFIAWAKEHGISVGPGRGSAAGSMVAYVMGITDIDPIRYKLLFERFLNPERVSPPDIDVDFCVNRRGEVIEYVRNKYGERAVSQIVTFGTWARSPSCATWAASSAGVTAMPIASPR